MKLAFPSISRLRSRLSLEAAGSLWGPVAGFAVAGLLGVLGIVELTAGRSRHQEVFGLLDRHLASASVEMPAPGPTPANPAEPPPRRPDKPKTRHEEQADRVGQRNVFAPPQVRNVQFQLIGVLGDQALFAGGQAVTAGQDYQGARVKEVGPDWVELEYEGKPMRLTVFSGQGPLGGAGGPGAPKPDVSGLGTPLGPGQGGPDGMPAGPMGPRGPRPGRLAPPASLPDRPADLPAPPPSSSESSISEDRPVPADGPP